MCNDRWTGWTAEQVFRLACSDAINWQDYLRPLTHPDEQHLFEVLEQIPVYKKVDIDRRQRRHRVIELILPPGAIIRLSNNSSGKCRADHAVIDRERWLEVAADRLFGYSQHDYDFEYRNGSIVFPVEPFELGDRECASGIHFFFEYEKAKAW